MIVDSSALLAVILNEEDEPRYAEALVDATSLRISAANWLETAIVVDHHRNTAASSRFEDLMAMLRIEVVPVTAAIAGRARLAHAEFGRGRHPARLNYGDCFSYALAKVERERLLYKGNDFALTDIESALKD